MSSLDSLRSEANGLFQLYRRLEKKRIEEYKRGGNALEIEKNKAIDHFILYVALHQLVQGNVKGYEERKTLLLSRLGEGQAR